MFKKMCIICLMFSIMLSNSHSIRIHSFSSGYGNIKINFMIHGLELFQMVENDEDFNILSTLSEMKGEFEEELNSVSKGSIRSELILEQIRELESNISLVVELKRINRTQKSLEQLNLLIDFSSSSLIPDLCLPVILDKIAIVAWLQNKNYKLSAELLNYSFINKIPNRQYTPNPNNTSQILNTQWFFEHKGQSSSGTDIFTTGDLHYAINRFIYYYGYDFDIYKYIVIDDLYDYIGGDQSYPTIAGLAVDSMDVAQQAGCLVPFRTMIYLYTN